MAIQNSCLIFPQKPAQRAIVQQKMPGSNRAPRRGTSADTDASSEKVQTPSPPAPAQTPALGNSTPTTPPEQPISHAAARKARKRRKTLDTPSADTAKNAAALNGSDATTTIASIDTTTPPSSTPSSPRTKPRKPPNNPSKKSTSNLPPPTSGPTMPPSPLRPLLILSLGNPPPTYAHTLHSAGHTVLQALRPRLPLAYTPFAKDKTLGGALASRPEAAPAAYPTSFLFRREGEQADDWTLVQSPALMNVSGKAAGEAWRRWVAGAGANGDAEVVRARRERGVLVVVHDELERELGWVGKRTGGSARGHNGVKSVQKALPGVEVVRVGVGIGRPVSREPEEVARYVLRKMTGREREEIEGCADGVIGLLREIEEGR